MHLATKTSGAQQNPRSLHRPTGWFGLYSRFSSRPEQGRENRQLQYYRPAAQSTPTISPQEPWG
jgi:hypothetical protein